MKIVIVGAKERDTPSDKQLVEQLIEDLGKLYPNCLFVTMLTKNGVGSFVREKCSERDANEHFRFQLLDLDLHVYARGLSKAEMTQIYIARNATLYEIGDAFYYLANPERKGTLEDLIQRVEMAGRKYQVLLPGDVPVLL